MTDDATFERDLRAMLAARDPGAAQPGLAAAVRLRLATDRRPGIRERLAGPLAAATLVAAALVLAFIVARPIATGPGASPAPAPGAYAMKPGDGVVTGEYVPLAQAAFAAAVVIALAWVARTAAVRWRRIGAVLGILVVWLVATSIGTSDALGEIVPFESFSPSAQDPGKDGEYVLDVSGDQPFRVDLTIENASRLPLEVVGMAADPRSDFRLAPRLVGMGLRLTTVVEVDPAAQVLPFQPTVVQPGGTLGLSFLGSAGTCARRPTEPHGGWTAVDRVVIVYEQLTIRHWATVELPNPISVPGPPGGCS